MNIFHEATLRLELKNKYSPAVFYLTGSISKLTGIMTLYGIHRKIEKDNTGKYYILLPYNITSIIDEAIKIRDEADRKHNEGGF